MDLRTKLNVSDAMNKKILTVDIDSNVYEIAKLMASKHKDYLIVNKKSQVKGIVTESDIIRKVVSKNIEPKETKVEEIMSKNLIVTTPSTNISDAAKLMLRNHIRKLPVIDESELIGVISVTDIVSVSPELINILYDGLSLADDTLVISDAKYAGNCEECGNYSDYLFYADGKYICEDCK